MAFLAAYGAYFAVQEYALADVRLKIAFGTLGVLTCSVTERALAAQQFDCPLALAKGAFFRTQSDLV